MRSTSARTAEAATAGWSSREIFQETIGRQVTGLLPAPTDGARTGSRTGTGTGTGSP
ncbi:hypothetical protein [Sphaerisporangium dianthi]|uniref:Uncharacterized protein n=1 Tax=Sphaerisporangium dianthi TaxID=1436120 RepID=A0ABV9CGR5_9ACTN